jgi:hypothetical protein
MGGISRILLTTSTADAFTNISSTMNGNLRIITSRHDLDLTNETTVIGPRRPDSLHGEEKEPDSVIELDEDEFQVIRDIDHSAEA